MKKLLISLIKGYRKTVSPLVQPRCRFYPTCSSYAIEAVERHGALKGGWMSVKRICRCNPFGGSGVDPVPNVENKA